jgi:DNA polymerase III epsilon subunit-like protein
MKYFAIDLETTGLDPEVHAITEMAAIYADIEGKQPIKMFYRWVNPEGFVWSQYCLNLHAEWLTKVNLRVKAKQFDGNPVICENHDQLRSDFESWIHNELEKPLFDPQTRKQVRYNAAGKNFASFDLQFLKKIGLGDMWRHRSLDPTPLYLRKGDEILPELKTCKERAILDGAKLNTSEVAHNAIQDAMDVVDLIRFGFTNHVVLG